MKDIKIIVTKKVASVEGTPIIVCGNSDYTLSFTFDDEWRDEQNKVARFSFIKNGLKSFIDMPIHENTCQVPVLIGIGLVRVGVYAGDLKTTTGAKIKCHKSILCDDADTMDEPFENLYDELLDKIEDIKNTGGDGSGDGSGVNIVDLDFEAEFKDNEIYNANTNNFVINELHRLILEKQDDNLVQEVNENSVDGAYPSAKAVYKYGRSILREHKDLMAVSVFDDPDMYPSNQAVFMALVQKQDVLESGTNIKTINGQSILGEGNLVIEGGGSSGSNWTVKEETYTIEGGESGTSGSFALTPQTPSVSNFTEAYLWAKVSSTVSGTHRINFDNARTQIVPNLQIGTTPSRLALHIIKIGDILYAQKVDDVNVKTKVGFTSDTTLRLGLHWSNLTANEVITSVGGIMYR